MRRAVLALGFVCALAAAARAQQPQQDVTLKLSVDQAMLVVETLKQVRCDSVAALILCEKAKAILEAVQAQAREQLK